MSNFWNTSDNQPVQANTSFDSGGGDFEPIPNNTGAVAAIEEAKWDHPQFDPKGYISLKWRVLQPESYKNRVVFQKVRVMDGDSGKRDKALAMLAAVDANAGGKLRALNKQPEDYDLASALVGKMMGIKVMVWEMEIDGQQRKGNWISAVAPINGAAKQPAQQPVAAQPAAAPVDNVAELDSIPF